jgi:homogentisate 1,2-dioxygenase
MKHSVPISAGWLQGDASRQAHVGLPPGTFERELGREGFFGPATQMYHTHPPTGWSSWEGPLRPRAFDLTGSTRTGSPAQLIPLLYNDQLKLRFWNTDQAMDHLVRNADGDELLFVHAGKGELFCDYGHLSLRPGDYVVLPRGTMWRTEPTAPMAVLLVEATGSSYALPDKGIVGQHAIFDPAMLDTPVLDESFAAQQSDEPWRVVVKCRNELSTVSYPFNPLDAVGWSGDLAPVRINMEHIRPLMSHRYHLPPSAHTTFVADGFVICSFVPRPFETDPEALKVPFFHSNDDYDEVLFYHAGDFFSRDNIDAGMLTFHPAGFTHGPHPKALANMLTQSKPATDEYAVMLDARQPLTVGAPDGVRELKQYADSWSVHSE